jgi:hypothetical protein
MHGILGDKRQGCEAVHSPPLSAEVRNDGAYTFTLAHVFMVLNIILGQLCLLPAQKLLIGVCLFVHPDCK